VNTENLYIFGGGKRSCLGGTLVKATLFTYITTLVQNYNFSISPTDHKKPTLENPIFGFTSTPQPFVAAVKPRPFGNVLVTNIKLIIYILNWFQEEKSFVVFGFVNHVPQ